MSVNLHHSVSLSSSWFFVCRGCCGWWCGVWCGVCAPSQSSPVMGLRAGCGAPPVLSALASLVEKCSSRPPGRCYVVETALLARGPRYVEGRDEGLRHCPPCRSVLCCLHPVEPCRVSVPRSPPASGCRGAPKPPMSPSRTPGRKARGAADVTVRTIAADPFPSPPSLSPLGFQARFCLGWAALNHSRLSLSLSLSSCSSAVPGDGEDIVEAAPFALRRSSPRRSPLLSPLFWGAGQGRGPGP